MTNSKSSKTTLTGNLVHEVSSLIRHKILTLPALKPLDNPHPIVENEDVFIINEMNKCKGLRKVHLETGYTKNIEVMHCVFFPNPEYPLPIFGADIVATPKIITAAICDISPVHKANSIYYGLDLIAQQYKFKERRQLPEWADIFSDYVQFMRIRDNKEKDMFVELVSRYLDIYIEHVYGAKRDQNWINNMKRMDDQIWYCKQQRQNKKTKAVLGQWFDPEWADDYINNTLFDVPNSNWQWWMNGD